MMMVGEACGPISFIRRAVELTVGETVSSTVYEEFI